MDNLFVENPTWAIGIVIALFAIVVSYRQIDIRNKRSKIIQAVTEFKNSFAEIIHELKTTSEGAVFNLGGTIEEGHERAKTQLEVCLSGKGIRRLNKIWSQYKRDTKKYYAKISGHNQDPSSQWREEFISEINSMLQKVSKIT
ncbi:hypothetical protein H8D57_00335 [bacterium]|nr:hypothetical protein [bacterium]